MSKQAQTPEVKEQTPAEQIAEAAEAAIAAGLNAQVVHSGQKGASPALRTDH